MKPHLFSFVTVIAFASTARGDTVWTQALDGGAALASKQAYQRALDDGDTHVQQANACMVSPNERRRQIEVALDSYRRASAARPSEGEPHYRTAQVLDAFFVCSSTDRTPPDPEDECGGIHRTLCTDASFGQFAPQLVAELDAFEARAPLDPRLSVIAGESSVLFTRAIVKTKLATKTQLEGAARDYEKIIARADGPLTAENVISNLAETYMMLDRLDDAIDRYLQAANGGGSDAVFGLAVALDRNGQTDRARRVLGALQPTTIQAFHKRVHDGSTFFVPLGEVHYYEAMIEESRNNDQLALQDWRAYIKSNAHPEFQPNAQAHIADILKRLAARPPAAPSHEIDNDY